MGGEGLRKNSGGGNIFYKQIDFCQVRAGVSCMKISSAL